VRRRRRLEEEEIQWMIRGARSPVFLFNGGTWWERSAPSRFLETAGKEEDSTRTGTVSDPMWVLGKNLCSDFFPKTGGTKIQFGPGNRGQRRRSDPICV